MGTKTKIKMVSLTLIASMEIMVTIIIIGSLKISSSIDKKE